MTAVHCIFVCVGHGHFRHKFDINSSINRHCDVRVRTYDLLIASNKVLPNCVLLICDGCIETVEFTTHTHTHTQMYQFITYV